MRQTENNKTVDPNLAMSTITLIIYEISNQKAKAVRMDKKDRAICHM